MFLRKQLTAKSRSLDTEKHSILDVFASAEKQGRSKMSKENARRR